ncbi:nuclear factor of activated T-cells 5-like isoform X1 [Schistocerca americana]|uniref:nuclear factor of activated T-cells 5-like isoform X1 n=2 Tax=Schistocerca americana TaxID=7009 RepID=UPI001F4FA9C8|nr:nuclear factor of activated T-cells 5-like isoform X1 [Schistocerca americana]
MLLKYSQSEKKQKTNGAGKQQRGAGTMKLIVSTPLPPRPHRRSVKGLGAKRPALTQTRASVAGGRDIRGFGADPCENSNDSGLGFDHHLDYQLAARPGLKVVDQEVLWSNDHPETKRKKLDIKLESDDANDNFGFSETMSRGRKDLQIPGSLLTSATGEAGRGVSSVSHSTGGIPRTAQGPPPARPLALSGCHNTGPVSLSTQLSNISRDGRSHLQILCQPEQQHRARYQTEGSRGAVKDRSGNGFPIVKLVGYNKPAVMQVFIGTDMGRVAPHMFYQACRVSGKNSTPCVEKKIDGTIVIEVDFDPTKDMVITCDCVGILKERNVDVEHRFPEQSGTRNKKKSTRCRMVFRTTITHDDGSTEILQTASQPIVCTQPPGVPEICKKSISSCPCTGGMEIFILGKNFLKDSRVLFQHSDTDPCWEESVQPDKEFLQQTHLVCTVPPYRRIDISEPVTVKLLVMSSGKTSEPHTFTYLPTTNPVVAAALQAPAVGATHLGSSCLPVAQPTAPPSMELSRVYGKSPVTASTPTMRLTGQHLKSDLPNVKNQFHPFGSSRGAAEKDVRPLMMWQTPAGAVAKEEKKQNEQSSTVGVKMLPLPPLLPLPRRTPDVQLIIPDMHAPELKTELADESSQSSSNQLSPEDLKGIDLRMKPVTTVGQLATAADLSSTQSPSMATFRRFVSGDTYLPLPSQTGQSVEKFLSHLEDNSKDASQQASTYKIAENSSSSGSSTTAVVTSQGLPVEKPIAPFSSQSVLFETSQQQTLLTPRHVLQQQPSQKIGFVGDIQLASLYDSQERSDKAESPKKSPPRQEAIGQSQTLQESVPQPQRLQTALVQPQTLQEAFSQSRTLQEAFTQSQGMQEAFSQPQALQGAMAQSHSLQEAMAQSQSLQEAIAQSQSAQEVISQPHSLRDAMTQPQSLQETVTQQQSLQQAITNSQSLQEAQSQSVQQAITGSQSLQNAITHSQTLQETITQNQLMALSNLSSPPLSNLCNQQTSVTENALTCRSQISEVREPQVTSENPLNISQMMSTLPEQGVVIQTPTPLLFRNTQESVARDTVSMDTKSDDQMMESMSSNLEARPLSNGSHTTGSGHSSPVGPSGSGGLNIPATSPPSSTPVLLNQEQQSLISSSGLEALVSSAMDSHMVSATEKLDAIVNSAADSHMANQSASVARVNEILNSQVSVGLRDRDSRGDAQQSSVLVESIRLQPSLSSVSDLNPFHLNSVQPGQQSAQISQETIILNNAVSAAIDEHLRRQDAGQKETIVSGQCTLINTSLPTTSSGLPIDTPSTSNSVLLKNPHISPIAVKSMILDTSVTVSVDSPVLITSPKNSSPIAVKHMDLNSSPLESQACLSNSAVASALSAENDIRMQVSDCSPAIAVKNIINSHSRNIENTSAVVAPTLTLSAKNNKTEILEPSSCLSSAASAAVHPHSLCSLLNSTNASTLVSSSSQIQKSPLIITKAPNVSSDCLETETTLPNDETQSQEIQNHNEVGTNPCGQARTATSDTSESVMVSHTSLLNSMYAAASDSQNVNFSAGSGMVVGMNSVESCQVRVPQIESLNNLPHSSTEIPQNSALPEDNMLASKTVNSIIGLTSDVKERLDTVGGQTSVGEYPVSDRKVCCENNCSETKKDQESAPSNFTQIADPVETAKTVDQQHKVTAAPSLPVPVAEISSASTPTKVLATSSTVQKKCEEGMVPQELTQMSESDLISYINPSCFDQV